MWVWLPHSKGLEMVAWMWLAAAGILIGIEILTADLLFASLSLSAFAAALAGWAGLDLPFQIAAFAVTATITIGMLRPIALKQLHKQSADGATGIDALIGVEALALTEINQNEGQIKLAGEIWTAHAETGVIAKDSKVQVVRISGATAIVKEQG